MAIKQDGNQIIAITKNGEEIILKPLKNYEGEILADTNGNVILGSGEKYFIKDGQIISSPDQSIAKGDLIIPTKIKKVQFTPYDPFYKTVNEGEISGNMPSVNWGYKTKNMSRTRRKIFPIGDGDAKAPAIKKKRKKSKK